MHVVWFKRDLRLQDHAPLAAAMAKQQPILLLYVFEPSVMQYGDSDIRHWRFVWESITALQQQLQPHEATFIVAYGEVLEVLAYLQANDAIANLYSYEETGNAITFSRDKAVAAWCKQHAISWQEFPSNGIIRGLRERTAVWNKHWFEVMHAPQITIDVVQLAALTRSIFLPERFHLPQGIQIQLLAKNKSMQPGGVYYAQQYLQSFIRERAAGYSYHISKPEKARFHCSRLSAYIAYGNMSVRQVYQASQQAVQQYPALKKQYRFFQSRLLWHCHFIQKFETQCSIEFNDINAGFQTLNRTVNETYLQAWQRGETGYPLVDACMQCLITTGYLNFRMRAMLVSFATHHLWLPWQAIAQYLAQQFLDYEPGIHYPQLQMQAGCTGINTIRIYNPTKQAEEHDAGGVFIKKWLPAMANVPVPLLFTPWKLTAQEQLLYQCVLGDNYPLPIVDITLTGKYAREMLWSTKQSKAVKAANSSILGKLTIVRKGDV
ncbi:MAG TPA: deoxyribodipyrimidine photolyase [Chitinophagaceae bacterium]|nr:deoxyribodipyrimidine photolyase [Chitinophagaceae bacterium]HAN39346.1 deoxyribodipyrimidine photolyase [Chitinophagaceae bacterium]